VTTVNLRHSKFCQSPHDECQRRLLVFLEAVAPNIFNFVVAPVEDGDAEVETVNHCGFARANFVKEDVEVVEGRGLNGCS
jgi:hypothetical protein